ncbi:MAG: winged helix-turn-helix transcriptional regulator [Polaribacter sp.]|nr:winged helix-turn-helix transcriptional regulator [Polaribacter sp.]
MLLFLSGDSSIFKKIFPHFKSLLNSIEIKTNVDAIKIGNYSFNLTKQTLQNSLEIEQLTHREAQLLFYLFEKKNEVLDRTFILNKLWGNDDFFNARSMDVFISKLRKKLKKDTNIQIINIRGFGYKLIC